MGGEGFGWGGQGLSKGEIWVGGGGNAQDPLGWKRGLWGVGLRLKEQKGPRCAPHLWSQRAGDLTWEPSKLPGLEWEGPSRLPLLISPASGVPILSDLQFSSPLSPPTSYQFTLGFLPSPWASESPTSSRQVP